MDSVIKLLRTEYTKDEVGNVIAEYTERQVFCEVRSVTRSEYYQASQTNLHPEYVFRLSHFKDYQGETELLFTDWTGVEKRYDIVRTYLIPESDMLELTTDERIGNGG